MTFSLLSLLGLQVTVNGHQLSNYAPAFLLLNWLFAYCTLSTRFMKKAVGLDHNASPRKDLATYGDAAVKAGKLTQQRLEQIERMQAAHENSVEGYAFFVAASESFSLTFLLYSSLLNFRPVDRLSRAVCKL